MSARRRWHDAPENLRDGKQYRPASLARLSGELDELDPATLGIGVPPSDDFVLYEVKYKDTLWTLAERLYGDAKLYKRIFLANLHKLETPQRIYVGQSLRIPREGLLEIFTS